MTQDHLQQARTSIFNAISESINPELNDRLEAFKNEITIMIEYLSGDGWKLDELKARKAAREQKIMAEFRDKLLVDEKLREKTATCPVCYSNIKDRKIALYAELIDALYEVYKWCGQFKRHEFETKEIKHLLGKNEYARFGDLVRFGGIVYKPRNADDKTRKGWFGINMQRAKEFFAGEREIPIQININQLNKEVIDKRYIKIGDFPKLATMLKDHGLYDYEKDYIDY